MVQFGAETTVRGNRENQRLGNGAGQKAYPKKNSSCAHKSPNFKVLTINIVLFVEIDFYAIASQILLISQKINKTIFKYTNRGYSNHQT